MIKFTMSAITVFGLAVGAVAGQILLFEEFRDPAAVAKNWTSYYHFPKPDDERTFIEKKQAQLLDGMMQLQPFAALYTIRENFRNVQIDFDMRAIENVEKDGKGLGFVGIQVRRNHIPLRRKDPAQPDNCFRLICKIGEPIPHWDIPGTITETDLGITRSKMPVFELNRWYSVRLVCTDRVTVYIDGVEVGQTPPGQKMNDAGALALWSVNAISQFRNLIVRDLDGTEK